MLGFGTFSPAILLIVLLLVLIWMVVLVWLGDRMLGYVSRRTGWSMRDWRNWLVSTALLIALIHVANWAIDVAEAMLRGSEIVTSPGWPGAFLIGSVAIGVPIAALRRRRK